MEFFLILFIAIILIVAAAMLVVLYHLRKGYRFIKRMANGEMTEEDFERLSKKNYKRRQDNIKFDKDYFKTTNNKQSQEQQPRSNRTFRTSDGITITDQRTQSQSKKIFAQDEGEYVDFKEKRLSSIVHQGANLIASHYFLQVTHNIHVEDIDRQIIVLTHTDSGEVHHLQPASQHLFISNVRELCSCGVFLGVSGIDTIHTCSLQHHVGLNLDATK